jgi:hypothetical protein
MSLPFEVREATAFDALEFAGSRPMLRKLLPMQARRYPSLLVSRAGVAVAFVTFASHPRGRVEFAMLVKPPAQEMMIGLVRLAHLTLCHLAQDGTRFYAHVRASSEVARRMARLVGFRPLRFRDGSIWLFREARDDRISRELEWGHGKKGREGGCNGAPAKRRCPGAAAFDHGGGNLAHGAHPEKSAGPQASC